MICDKELDLICNHFPMKLTTPPIRKIFQGIIFSFIVFASCDSPIENAIDPNYSVTSKSNSFASFKSFEEFQKAIDKLQFLSQDELSNWEREKGYVSYRTVYRQALDEWLLISEDDEEEFVKKYSDILTLENGSIIPKIKITLYQSIVNRDGIYETGDFVNKIQDNFILSVDKKDAEKLNLSESIVSGIRNNKNKDYGGVRYFKFSQDEAKFETQGKVQAICSTNMTASYFYNQSNCRNDRQVFISARSYYTVFNNYEGDRRQPRVEIKVWGKLRTGTFCNWKEYATTLSYRNVSFSIMAWEVVGLVATPKLYNVSLPDYYPTDDRLNLPWDQPIGNPVLNQGISASAFTNLHAEGSSRGVNGNWAIIDCQ